MLLQDKVCIVTGGGSGIGEAAARRFASAGAAVVVTDIARDEAERVAQAISGAHGEGRALAVHADVADERSVRALMDAAASFAGRIDVLMNNAAAIMPGALEEVEESAWTRLTDINLKSMFLATKHAIAHLRRTRGAIVNMASLNGLIGQRMNASYAATKGGVIAMTKALALDYAADGVRVNCICPAGVATPLLEKWIGEQPDPALVRRQLNEMHALGRPASPEEIADAALFLASGLARFVTGVALPVDGGASLGY